MLSRIFLTALGLPTPVLSHPSTEIGSAEEKICIVEPCAGDGDSAPAILQAFQECGHNDGVTTHGTVIFKNETYHIKTVMNTTGLSNLKVDHRGTLLWDQNIPYWLNSSLPVGYQNQSSAWLFGGHNIHWDGHGYGTLDGNGEVWYEFINGTNNYPGRPHQITYTGVTDCVFENIRFVQSQMWTMTLIHARNVLLEKIYVNSTDVRPVGFEFSSLNTDGADTIYADNITFRGWTVDNGDDSISIKANSTNILIEDCDFHTGLGVAIGSIGQYDNQYEIIENVTARNIRSHNMRYGVASGGCDTSLFNIRNFTIASWTGTATSDVIAELQCSGAAPCTGAVIEDMGGLWDTIWFPTAYLKIMLLVSGILHLSSTSSDLPFLHNTYAEAFSNCTFNDLCDGPNTIL
ncbi:hypothetical protein EYC84_008503 [Monilinia fructicola]|uniref:Pectate lyase superfamily protein domain-containing protein n=1 Tax=Monilinia fructicola TaxID=38448 RepID=A0A5M9JM23_MONFR|nr:hypothetical protein EYC84_008503 [Monilinia fructicola]